MLQTGAIRLFALIEIAKEQKRTQGEMMKNNIRQNVALLTCGAAIGLTFGTNVAEAQRDRADRQVQRQDNRERRDNLTPEQRAQFQQQRGQNMTPEQRQQMEARRQQFMQQREQQRTDWIRQALIAAGYTDANLQDSVIDMMKVDTDGLAKLQEMERQLAAKLVEPTFQADAFPAELKAFRDAVQQYQDVKKAKLEKFDATYKYTTQPKLETTLTVLGVLGQETNLLGGLGQIFPDSPYGRGGFGRGGGQGGGPGGGGPGGGRGN
jgi:hypothetical protein